MATRIARLALMHVNPSDGSIFQRGGNSKNADGDNVQELQDLPVKGALSFDTQFRVIEDAANDSTVDNPSIEAYVLRESKAGRDVVQINQTMIITAG